MQYIIILAVIIGIISSISKKKKQQEQKNKSGQNGQPAAKRSAQSAAARPAAARNARPKPEGTGKTNVPATFTPEEWVAYVNAKVNRAVPTPAAETEGETFEEHAEHNARVHAREQAERERFESLRDRRFADRQRMREAVVMSEILGKPVSLRERRTAVR